MVEFQLLIFYTRLECEAIFIPDRFHDIVNQVEACSTEYYCRVVQWSVLRGNGMKGWILIKEKMPNIKNSTAKNSHPWNIYSKLDVFYEPIE